MATLANAVSVEEYLHNPEWERCEYVDGAIEERGTPTYDHSAWMNAICHWFGQHAEEWNIRVRPSHTNKASETRYRIPDVSIIDFDRPKESAAAVTPPLAAFEVWSPDDRISRVLQRLNDLETMGVAQIWLVDPADGVWQRFADGRLTVCEEFRLADRKIRFPMGEITKLVR
jgi:Uma2 family endonuclease